MAVVGLELTVETKIVGPDVSDAVLPFRETAELDIEVLAVWIGPAALHKEELDSTPFIVDNPVDPLVWDELECETEIPDGILDAEEPVLE